MLKGLQLKITVLKPDAGPDVQAGDSANRQLLVQPLAQQLKPEFTKLGIQLDSLTVQSVSLPEELQKVLDQKIGMGMVGNDMAKFMQYQTAQAIPKFAEGAGGGGGSGIAGDAMGLGAGVALGQVLAQNLAAGLQGSTAGAAAAAAAAAQAAGVVFQAGVVQALLRRQSGVVERIAHDETAPSGIVQGIKKSLPAYSDVAPHCARDVASLP